MLGAMLAREIRVHAPVSYRLLVLPIIVVLFAGCHVARKMASIQPMRRAMIGKFIATLSLAVVLSLAGLGTNPAFAGCKTELEKYKLSEGQTSHDYTCRSATGCKCSITKCPGEKFKQTCLVNPQTSIKIDKPTAPENCKNVSSDAVKWKETWNGVKCTYGPGYLCFAVLCTNPANAKASVWVQSAKCQTVSP
jgi:hypothetical protein